MYAHTYVYTMFTDGGHVLMNSALFMTADWSLGTVGEPLNRRPKRACQCHLTANIIFLSIRNHDLRVGRVNVSINCQWLHPILILRWARGTCHDPICRCIWLVMVENITGSVLSIAAAGALAFLWHTRDVFVVNKRRMSKCFAETEVSLL